MSLYKQNMIEKSKIENGLSSQNYQKDLLEEKEHNISNLTNIKVFNGLVKEEKDIFKNLNNKNSNKNTKNKKDLDSYFNDKKNIDLNYISFGDCDNLFINNIPKESKKIEKQINKDFENKNKQKIIVEERLLNNNNQIKNLNKSKELFNEFIPNKNILKKTSIEKNQTNNFFKISEIKKGEALVVTNDDIIFSLPACLLPKEAKLGDTFSLEIKLFNNEIKQKELEEIGLIQKKYSEKIIDENQESK
jgi:hypothetical protein